jgi:eukaryotic-like serine/threonine-protein kinase
VTITPTPIGHRALDDQNDVPVGELDALVDAVLDGDPVDWAAAEADAGSDPEHRALVRQLAILAGLTTLPGSATQPMMDRVEGSADGAPWQHLIVQEEVGRGGFGVVVRAWDSRLLREVALKLLKPPEERVASAAVEEGRLLARVRHPNVVTVYDAARRGTEVGIWMEFIRGRTLAEIVRIDGPFGPEETVVIGLAVCGALAALHGAGLLHQDVKAQNVMRERGGRIVLMDFGAAAVADAPHGLSRLGAFGSPLYLAPEVLAGTAPSRQSDIYSFGVLLFFLLTGSFPSTGDDLDAIRAAHRQGQRRLLRDVRPDVPMPLVTVIDRCLEPKPEARFATVGAIEGALAHQVTTRTHPQRGELTHWRRWSGVAGWTTALVCALALIWSMSRTRDPLDSAKPTVFSLSVPDAAGFDWVTLSPDGRTLAIVAQDGAGETAIWVRQLEKPSVTRLEGTSGASFPFWSRDGSALAFFADGALKKISATGGAVQTICQAPNGRGGAWNRDGDLVLAPMPTGALVRVPATGGTPEPVTVLDRQAGQNSHRWPLFLADGRRFLFLARSAVPEKTGIFLASLDSRDPPRRVLSGDSNLGMLGDGHLLLSRDRTLMAQPFDPVRGEARGEAFPVVSHLAFSDNRRAGVFSASPNKVLTYWTQPPPRVRLRWVNRHGKERSSHTVDGSIINLAVSPDNRRVALERLDPRVGTDDIWLLDWTRGALARLTSEPSNETDPVWSPDGTSLLFSTNRLGSYQLFRQRLDLAVPPERVPHADVPTFAEDWSRHGDIVAIQGPDGDRQIRMLPLRPGEAPRTLVEGPFPKDEPHLSPDGRLLAYHAAEAGRSEVHVIALDGSNRKWQVSIDGGVQARWSRNGRELFFLGLDGSLKSAVWTSASRWSLPRTLFQTELRPNQILDQYAVSNDDRHFLLAVPIAEAVAPVTVTLNWPLR